MPSLRRLLWTAGITAGLASTGVVALLWTSLDGVWLPWQRQLAPFGTPPEGERERERGQAELIARLSSENVLLRTRLEEYQAIKGEGQVPPEQVVVARGRVVSLSRRSGRRYLELDVGGVEAVAKGQAVCAGWSLVGTVAGVQEGRCLVQLLTDSESRVPANLIGTGPGAPRVLGDGVLAGRGRRQELALEWVEHREGLTLSPGLPVVTSGSDGRLPPGLVLGLVARAERGLGAHWNITVAPIRDAELAESLLVLRFPGR